MSAVEDIRIKLEQRLSELDKEIESLRSALTALDNEEAASHASQAAPPSPAKPARRGGRRATASTRAAAQTNGDADRSSSAELERLLAETGGSSAVELARETGTDYGVVLARIRQLERAGQGQG